MFLILVLLAALAAWPTWAAFKAAERGEYDAPVNPRPNYYV